MTRASKVFDRRGLPRRGAGAEALILECQALLLEADTELANAGTTVGRIEAARPLLEGALKVLAWADFKARRRKRKPA